MNTFFSFSEIGRPDYELLKSAKDMQNKDMDVRNLDKPLAKDKDGVVGAGSNTDIGKKEVVDGITYYYDDYGSTYRVDNELLPDNTYDINGYKYETDGQGRIASVEGELHLKDRDSRLPIKDTIDIIGRGDQEATDDRGHLIGDQFDGSNGLENMIPQNADINRGDFKNYENALASEVKNDKIVCVKIEPQYSDASYRPDAIVATSIIDGKEDIRIFPNSKEGY